MSSTRVVVGAAIPLHLVLNLADITNPLAGLVKKLKDDYFSRTHQRTY